MGADIKQAIAARRRERIALEGHALGHAVPATRSAPLVAFDRPPFVICEVKRRSPSRGAIATGLNAVDQARRYVEAGVRTISVLTEEDQFGGSLADLMAIKAAFPDTAVLRKDFLLDRGDVDVAYRAGADAILLIASLLEAAVLADLKAYAEGLGLAVFVEVHDRADCAKAAPLRPAYTGINCRNLADFSLDRALPLQTRAHVTWPTRLVFESGIFRAADAVWAAEAGFQGVLVGEGAVKDPGLAAGLCAAFRPGSEAHPAPRPSFWGRLYGRADAARPLVKICGLTRHGDVDLADGLGADALGFIFAPSKRRVEPAFVRGLPPTLALKVGVVQLGAGEPVPPDVAALVDEGHLDALQFHGREDAGLVDAWASRGYKAVALTGPEAWQPWEGRVSPRLLADAGSGGSGLSVSEAVLEAYRASPLGGPRLWLAGGLRPETIGAALRRWNPELVDASSGLEESPGLKDAGLLRRYFKELAHARD